MTNELIAILATGVALLGSIGAVWFSMQRPIRQAVVTELQKSAACVGRSGQIFRHVSLRDGAG